MVVWGKGEECNLVTAKHVISLTSENGQLEGPGKYSLIQPLIHSSKG